MQFTAHAHPQQAHRHRARALTNRILCSVRSLWRGVVAARAPAPARFAATAAHALAAKSNAKRRTLRFVSVSVRCVGVGGTEALRSDAADPAVPSPSSVPRSVPVRVAYELQQAGHRYLDVRYGTDGIAQPRSLFHLSVRF